MNIATIRKRIKDFASEQEWNHQYHLSDGIRTREKDVDSPGYNTVKWERLRPILDKINLSGKKVLDVGSSDGFYAIKCALLGADVLGIEIDELRVDRANFMQKVLDVSNVSFISKSLYDFEGEKFDVILGLGLLHRIPNMHEFLKKASAMSDTLNDEVFDGKKQTKLNNYNTLHGIPTNKFVKNRLVDLGYTSFDFILDKDSHLTFKRTICVAKRGVENE